MRENGDDDKEKQQSAALRSWLVMSHTGLQTFCLSCCLEVNWLCRSRKACVGEVIKTVLAKENLAGTTAVVTQLRAEHKIATKRKQPAHRDWIAEVMSWSVRLREEKAN